MHTNNHSTTLDEREQIALDAYNTALADFRRALAKWDPTMGVLQAAAKAAQAVLAVAVADRQNADIGVFSGGSL